MAPIDAAGLDDSARQYPESQGSQSGRNAYERDRDRVLYSTAFRRLAGITQVAAPHERALLHNRLTHSLKVGQIARRLAQRVVMYTDAPSALTEVIDPDVAETAGLAHDLGHPPFGHSAEIMLNEKLRGIGGFEGNAQTFRIVTKLAVRQRDQLGLNLTNRTLRAIAKYPNAQADMATLRALRKLEGSDEWWRREYGAKWGAYRSELYALDTARREYADLPGARRFERSPEAIIMDWADDVSFATHDIEDYFRAGLIPLDNLDHHQSRLRDYAVAKLGKEAGFDLEVFDAVLRDNLEGFSPILSPYLASRGDRADVQVFTSGVIKLLTAGLRPLNEAPWVTVTPGAQYLAEYLKTVTRAFVIDNPATALARAGQVDALERVFDTMVKWLVKDPENPRIPRLLREMAGLREIDPYAFDDFTSDPESRNTLETQKDEAYCMRTVSDYLCSLTEAQVVDIAERLTGLSATSMFGAWFQ